MHAVSYKSHFLAIAIGRIHFQYLSHCSCIPGAQTKLIKQIKSIIQAIHCCRGRSRIFFRRGRTRLLLYFNTNKPLFFFFFRQNTGCIRKLQVISGGRGGGGAHPLHPPPRSAPVLTDSNKIIYPVQDREVKPVAHPYKGHIREYPTPSHGIGNELHRSS